MPTGPLQGPGHVDHGRRQPAHRDLLRGNACTYDTRCCGKECVLRLHRVEDCVMSACGDRSADPELPLPVFCASIALALILDGLHLGPSKIGGISTGRATSVLATGLPDYRTPDSVFSSWRNVWIFHFSQSSNGPWSDRNRRPCKHLGTCSGQPRWTSA